MPNAPRPDNPARTVRVDDELWAQVRAVAVSAKVPVSAVVREALARYVQARSRSPSPGGE